MNKLTKHEGAWLVIVQLIVLGQLFFFTCMGIHWLGRAVAIMIYGGTF